MKSLSVSDPIDFASVVHDAEKEIISVSDNGETIAFVVSAKNPSQIEEAKKLFKEVQSNSYQKLMSAIDDLDRTNPNTGAIQEEDYFTKHQ